MPNNVDLTLSTQEVISQIQISSHGRTVELPYIGPYLYTKNARKVFFYAQQTSICYELNNTIFIRDDHAIQVAQVVGACRDGLVCNQVRTGDSRNH